MLNTGRRKQLRLKNYNYSSEGYYFITVCVKNRENLLGEIIHGQMILNGVGRMVKSVWDKLPRKFLGIKIDEYIIMPDHFHGIIQIVGADPRVRPIPNMDAQIGKGSTHGSTPTLGKIIQWFKTMTTNYYLRGIGEFGWPCFDKNFWQRNYYEHIIRNDRELNETRQYIRDNPTINH